MSVILAFFAFLCACLQARRCWRKRRNARGSQRQQQHDPRHPQDQRQQQTAQQGLFTRVLCKFLLPVPPTTPTPPPPPPPPPATGNAQNHGQEDRQQQQGANQYGSYGLSNENYSDAGDGNNRFSTLPKASGTKRADQSTTNPFCPTRPELPPIQTHREYYEMKQVTNNKHHERGGASAAAATREDEQNEREKEWPLPPNAENYV